jgi:C-terminal processing protease CtpA/Prc
VAPGGTFARDGRILPGDYLVKVNGENMRNISHSQVRDCERGFAFLQHTKNRITIERCCITTTKRPTLVRHLVINLSQRRSHKTQPVLNVGVIV